MTWANIPDFPGYQANSQGDIRSFRQSSQGKLLRPHYDRHTGYLRVILRRDGKGHTRSVHSLIAITFIGPKPPDKEVCHYDGNKLNNNLLNLDYDTHSANQGDQVRHGTHWEANRTACDHGHPFTPDNTYWRKGKSGKKRYRLCKRCHAAAQIRCREKKKAIAAAAALAIA